MWTKNVIFVLFALVLAGCSFVETLQPDTKRLAVTYATAKIIDTNADRAARVLDLVEQGRAFIESDAEVSIDALYSGVMDRIEWQKIDPADRILIEEILKNARERLKDEIGIGLLQPDERVKVVKVLDWIESAASRYAAPL